jgi:outer membrane protein TolC
MKKRKKEKQLSIWKIGLIASIFFLINNSYAQEVKKITLKEVVELGLTNSKSLKLSQAKVEQAVAQYRQTQDKSLPTGSVSYTYNHAEIPTTKFILTDPTKPLVLPDRADVFLGTFSLQQVIFGGNRLKYARQSTELLTRVAELDIEKDKEEIVFSITNAYYNLYKLQQSKKVLDENIAAIDKQIHQSQRFFEQGLVTKNDVLRFQLQKSNLDLSKVDLETNRKIVVYNLDLMIGLPEQTDLVVDTLISPEFRVTKLENHIDSAINNRSELKSFGLNNQVAESNVRSIKGETLPTFLVGANAYYINPSSKFIPSANRYLAPLTVSATLSWSFDRLWTNKHRIEEARIQKRQVEIGETIALDQIKSEVNQNYQNYLKAIQKIEILQTSIAQAAENDKIVESKYNRNVASVTDRIDADAQLFQAKINLELAKADAGIAYYTLLKSTGTISK